MVDIGLSEPRPRHTVLLSDRFGYDGVGGNRTKTAARMSVTAKVKILNKSRIGFLLLDSHRAITLS